MVLRMAVQKDTFVPQLPVIATVIASVSSSQVGYFSLQMQLHAGKHQQLLILLECYLASQNYAPKLFHQSRSIAWIQIQMCFTNTRFSISSVSFLRKGKGNLQSQLAVCILPLTSATLKHKLILKQIKTWVKSCSPSIQFICL